MRRSVKLFSTCHCLYFGPYRAPDGWGKSRKTMWKGTNKILFHAADATRLTKPAADMSSGIKMCNDLGPVLLSLYFKGNPAELQSRKLRAGFRSVTCIVVPFVNSAAKGETTDSTCRRSRHAKQH